MALTAAATGMLAAFVLPRQAEIVEETTGGRSGADRRAAVQLAMFTGLFNLLWATVTVLVIVRPGVTTGAWAPARRQARRRNSHVGAWRRLDSSAVPMRVGTRKRKAR